MTVHDRQEYAVLFLQSVDTFLEGRQNLRQDIRDFANGTSCNQVIVKVLCKLDGFSFAGSLGTALDVLPLKVSSRPPKWR